MGVRGFFSHFRAWIIWGSSGLVLVTAGLVSLLLFTPLADDLGKSRLERALRREGIALSFGEMRGTVARGIDLTDLSVEKEKRWRVRAARAHLEVSLPSLLFGRPRLTAVVLEEGQLDIHLGDAAAVEAQALPSFAISRWELRGVDLRLLKGEEAFPWVGSWSDLDGEGSFSMAGRSLKLTARSFRGRSADSRLPALQGSGSLAWTRGSGARVEFSTEVEGGVLRHTGRIEPSRGAGPKWSGAWVVDGVDLRLLAPFWSGAPARRASGQFESELLGPRFSWKGEADLGASGRAEGTGAFLFGAAGTEVTGEAGVKAFALGSPPLLPALQGLSPEGDGTVRWGAEVGKRGLETWELWVEASTASVYGLPVRSGTAEIRSEVSGLTVVFEASSPLVESAEGTVSLSEGHWRAGIRGTGLHLEPVLRGLGYWTDPPAGLHLPESPWRSAELELTRSDQSLHLAIRGEAENPLTAQFALEAAAGGLPAWTLAVEGLDTASVGLRQEGRLSGSVAYRPEGPEAGEYRVTLAPSLLAGIRLEPASFRLARAGDGYRLSPCTLATSAGTVRLSGERRDDGALDGRVGLSLPELRAAASLTGTGALQGALEADVSVRGAPGNYRLDGKAALRGARYEALAAEEVHAEGYWALPDGALDLRTRWVGLTRGEQELGGGSLAVAGPPGGAQATLRADLGGGREWTLAGSGRVALTGVDLTVRESRFRLDRGEMVQIGEARASAGSSRWAVEGLELEGALGRMALSIRSSRGDSAESQGHLRLERLPLEAFPLPPTAGALGGSVSADLSWSGSAGHPSFSGWGKIEGGSYRFAESDLTWAPARLDLRAEGDRLLLTEGRVSAPEGGEALATGWVRLEGLWPGEFEVRSTGRGMPFVIGRDVEASGDYQVLLSGTLREPKISGRAEIRKGRLLLPDVARQAPMPASVTFKNAPAGSPFAPPPPEGARVVGRLRGRVSLHSDGGFWVSNRSLLGELAGEVLADFGARGVALVGGLQLRQGRYRFQNRMFDITSARILFGGSGEEDLVLDVVAVYLASDGTEVTVRLFGRPERPTVQLSSKPPLDSSGILAVLLYDHRPEQMSAQERTDWAAAAAALALQYQAGDLLDSVTRQVGLDAITLVTGDSGKSAGIGLVKSIGDRVVVEYQQLFGAVPEERVNLRYRVNRRLSFRGTSSSTEGSTADLLWEKRY